MNKLSLAQFYATGEKMSNLCKARADIPNAFKYLRNRKRIECMRLWRDNARGECWENTREACSPNIPRVH
jgi:hypothetical protein